jgi:cytoskeletal protein CcmA (bactofilin family)
MSFRQFGGLNYAPKHNIVASNYNTSNNLLVTQNVGQSNSYINFLSDISGNIRVYGDFDISGNLNVSGDVDISGNITAEYMFLSSYPPTFSNQANAVMPKAYIDALTGGVVPFGAVKAISTYDSSSNNTPGFYPVPLTFLSIFQIDGYTPSVGDLVLLNDQGTSNGQNPATLNGIYQLTGSPGSYSYVRSSVMPDGTDAKRAGVTVQQGISNERGLWVQTQEPAIVGQNQLLWTILFSFNYTLGQGLSIENAPNNKEVLFVDSSLNFLTLVDASSSFPTLNIGTENATTITMGKLNGSTTTNINGNTNIGGIVTATSFNATSDYRIKENIEILNENYNVDNLRPITYLNNKIGKQDIGLLAHELQEHFPCLVNGEKDAEELQTVNYTGLIPVLIKEIQELKKEIKLLKEKI